MRKKILSIFGTRPEGIKMAPVVKAIAAHPNLESIVCVTAQHRQLLDQVLEIFAIKPDFDLNVMKANQDLFDITINCLGKLREVFCEIKPDIVLVHGDTSTTFSAALAAYYLKIPVGHVEAGLRTGDKYSPFPEEMNRHMISPVVDFHFAPTAVAVENLRKENISASKIFNTGNSAIDALQWVLREKKSDTNFFPQIPTEHMILMTAHRRENFGEPLRNIFSAVHRFATENPQAHIVYPVHPNPNVKGVAEEMLGSLTNISLIAPVGYEEMAYLMNSCRFILTDSGGIQEEAPSLGKPVLVLRNTTERPEAVSAGCAALVASNQEHIYEMMVELSNVESSTYKKMSQAANPFGDGTTGSKIANILDRHL